MVSGLPDNESPILTDADRLVLHQLRVMEWLDSGRNETLTTKRTSEDEASPIEVPQHWELTGGLELYGWQRECVDRWFESGHRGTIKVVTGAGKTILALAITERLQREVNRELRVAIVVPTIVLMNQWYDELMSRSNLPPNSIGRLGDKYDNDFSGDRRILITVLATAYKKLSKLVIGSGVGSRLLMIADECHRAGATEMSRVLEAPRAYSLGLSATPERGSEDEGADNGSNSYDTSLLGKSLGRVIYELDLTKALELGVVPPFAIRHYGLSLSAKERAAYDQLSRVISDTRIKLQEIAPKGRAVGSSFFCWVRSASESNKGETSVLAARFIQNTNRRKELLQKAESRLKAVEDLLRLEFENNPNTRAILFHESIQEVMNIFLRLRGAGFSVVAEHSKLPQSVREDGLELFRRGSARVIVSAKSLIEGFNVPAADVGIIVASSSSVRQRIQSLGRVLRKHSSSTGEEKTSSIHILYIRDTVDEGIYGQVDWGEITGAERNLFFHWEVGSEPVQQVKAPRSPRPRDNIVDPSSLVEGGLYPGEYEGEEFSCDTKGNVIDVEGRFATNPGNVPEKVRIIKGGAGRFRVTPICKYVLVNVTDGEEWSIKYVGRLDGPFLFEERAALTIDKNEVQGWASRATPGDPYPFSGTTTVHKLRYVRRQGGMISKRIPGGEAFAYSGDSATDATRGRDAETLLAAIKSLHNQGITVSSFEINEHNHAVHRAGGGTYFIAALEQGLEFPST